MRPGHSVVDENNANLNRWTLGDLCCGPHQRLLWFLELFRGRSFPRGVSVRSWFVEFGIFRPIDISVVPNSLVAAQASDVSYEDPVVLLTQSTHMVASVYKLLYARVLYL